MFRLLIVEDDKEIYEKYLLRHLKLLLPMANVEIVHAPTMGAACKVLIEPWDAILMDYALGPPIKFFGDTLRDGASLIQLRKHLEAQGKVNPAGILGISGNAATNRLMESAGAFGFCRKDDVQLMANFVLERIPQE